MKKILVILLTLGYSFNTQAQTNPEMDSISLKQPSYHKVTNSKGEKIKRFVLTVGFIVLIKTLIDAKKED